LHKLGDQIGIAAEEALACGLPVIEPTSLKIFDSPAILKSEKTFKDADRKLKEFFALSLKKRKKLSKQARKYAEKTFSDKAWKDIYIDFYLK
jgi:glycosyltransferase involved in cell wall biosynthesis